MPVSHILAGNGSVEIIDLVARALLGPGDNAVISEHAFVRFRQIVAAHNHGARLVPMRNWTHDLAAMAGAIDERTRLVFVANPNNPTGTFVTGREVERFLAALPPGVIAVFDEAYYEYVARRTFPDTLRRVRAGLPVFCLRTFSKAYGIAGLRIGYLVGPPEHVAEMNKVREPFNTNHLAQVAALAALGDERHLRRVVRLNRRERERLTGGLEALGLEVIPSEANFVLGNARKADVACQGAPASLSILLKAAPESEFPAKLKPRAGPFVGVRIAAPSNREAIMCFHAVSLLRCCVLHCQLRWK